MLIVITKAPGGITARSPGPGTQWGPGVQSQLLGVSHFPSSAAPFQVGGGAACAVGNETTEPRMNKATSNTANGTVRIRNTTNGLGLTAYSVMPRNVVDHENRQTPRRDSGVR